MQNIYLKHNQHNAHLTSSKKLDTIFIYEQVILERLNSKVIRLLISLPEW